MPRRVLWIVLLALSTGNGTPAQQPSAVPAPARATASAPAPPDYTTRAIHDPDGIGKFYMGREIAKVMGHESAKWLDRPQRERQEQGARMLASLKIRPGDVVADMGAGSGYYTIRLARMVGPSGRVKAVDIQQEMLDLIRKRQKRQGLRNIDLVLGKADDPNLPPESLDLVLMVDVYHEFEWPFEMMQHIVRALKPGGRVAFVEFKREDPSIPIKALHKMSEAQVLKEMQPFDLTHQETVRALPWQQVIIFKKPSPASAPAGVSGGYLSGRGVGIGDPRVIDHKRAGEGWRFRGGAVAFHLTHPPSDRGPTRASAPPVLPTPSSAILNCSRRAGHEPETVAPRFGLQESVMCHQDGLLIIYYISATWAHSGQSFGSWRIFDFLLASVPYRRYT